MGKIKSKALCPYCKQDHLDVAVHCEKYPIERKKMQTKLTLKDLARLPTINLNERYLSDYEDGVRTGKSDLIDEISALPVHVDVDKLAEIIESSETYTGDNWAIAKAISDNLKSFVRIGE